MSKSKRTLGNICLSILFSVFLGSPSAFSANEVVLTTDQTTIRLTNENPVEIKVYPSDPNTLSSQRPEYLYFNNVLGGTGSETSGFYALTTSTASTYYVVRIAATKPIKNGTYKLDISQYSSKILSLTIIVDFKPEDIGVKLSTDYPTITFTENKPLEFKVYPSDLTTLTGIRSVPLYFNSNLSYSSTDGYVVKSIGQNQNFYTVQIIPNTPIKNGTYNLTIQQYDSQKLIIPVVINIDAKQQGLYETNFEFECYTTYFNENGKCAITPKIDGVGREQVFGKYKVSYSYRFKGSSSWTTQKNFSWDITEGVVSTFIKVTKPLEVRTNISFEGIQYSSSSTIYPKVRLNITSPNAAIVGQNFYLQVSTIKQYSGSCVVNDYSITFNVKNGFGKVLIYGKTPGNLNLYVNCRSNNWADSGGLRFVYIRQ